MTKQPSHVSNESFASDPLDYRLTTQEKDNLSKVMESWRPDPTDLYDPFTQPALDDEYRSEKIFYDNNLRLYQLCNQNFLRHVEVSKFEEQVRKLEAEAISQYHEYPKLLAWYQERSDYKVIERQHEQTQDHLNNILQRYNEYHNLGLKARLRSESAQSSKISSKRKYGFTLLEYTQNGNDRTRSSTTGSVQTGKRRRIEDISESSNFTTISSTAVEVTDLGHDTITDPVPDGKSFRFREAVTSDDIDIPLILASCAQSEISSMGTNLHSERTELERYLKRYNQILKDDARHGMFFQQASDQLTHVSKYLLKRLPKYKHPTLEPSMADETDSLTAWSPVRAKEPSLDDLYQSPGSSDGCCSPITGSIRPIDCREHSESVPSVRDNTGETDKGETVPAVELESQNTCAWPPIDAGWEEAFDEQEKNEHRFIKLFTKLSIHTAPASRNEDRAKSWH